MLLQLNNGPVWAAAISTRRPESELEHVSQCLFTWYVTPDDLADYRDTGKEVRMPAVRGLSAARNAALEDAWSAGLPCLQVSDDLKGCARLTGPNSTEIIPFRVLVTELQEQLQMSSFALAGVAPTDNAFYADETAKTRHFIVADLILVEPCDVYFDGRFKLKEDYDYTCQHYARFGGALRAARLLASFAHRSNPGGAVAIRTEKLEQQMIGMLRGKWGNMIVPNPRRPNEVLLKLPHRRKERLT